MRRQDAFFLHAGGGYVDLIAAKSNDREAKKKKGLERNSLDSNADAAARSGYPAQVIETATKLGNEVCGLIERASERSACCQQR